MKVSNIQENYQTSGFPDMSQIEEEDFEDLENQFEILNEKESIAQKKLESLEEFLFQEKEFMGERNKKKVCLHSFMI